MKRQKFCAVLLTALAFLLAAGAWAADRTAVAEGTPAILASLDNGNVTILDDQAAMAIRGQAYKYVLVRTVLNPLDLGPGLNWTNNLLGYRYGAWGGPGWTDGGVPGSNTPAADPMDAFFQQHDLGILTDQGLIEALKSLPNAPGGFWGLIYVPAAGDIAAGSGLPVGANVWVSGLSILGGRLFFGWRPMPFTEYSRREALTGMQLLGLRP
jgi:hypothetical protein